MKIEKDIDKVCKKLINSCNNAKNKNFTRGIVDYQLLIASKVIEKYESVKDWDFLQEAQKWLEEVNEILKCNSKDIRNEAFYYRLKAVVSNFENNIEEKKQFIEKAIELYSLMNCKKDIEFLESL